jgi:hypothetical protein
MIFVFSLENYRAPLRLCACIELWRPGTVKQSRRVSARRYLAILIPLLSVVTGAQLIKNHFR